MACLSFHEVDAHVVSPDHEYRAVGARFKRHHRRPLVRTGACVSMPPLETDTSLYIRRIRRGGRSDHKDQECRGYPDREL
jgi:hypothetical protein